MRKGLGIVALIALSLSCTSAKQITPLRTELCKIPRLGVGSCDIRFCCTQRRCPLTANRFSGKLIAEGGNRESVAA